MGDRHYTVYCHINKIDGKKYFGMTGSSVEERWANGHGYKNQPFGRAIRKYGWDAFEHKIIQDNLTEKEACDLEIELIAKNKTRNKKFGYNVCEGGSSGTTGVRYGEDVRENMRKATYLSYEKDPDMKRRISESVKKLYDNPEYAALMQKHRKEAWQRPGYREHQSAVRKGIKRGPRSEETKQKISKKNLGSKRSEESRKKMVDSSHKKPVMQFTKDLVFVAEYVAMHDAEKATGIGTGCISLCCQGKRGTAGGYVWKYKAGDFNGR